MGRAKILLLGKIPPPYMGPAVATQIILNSSLREKYDLIHVDTRVNTSLSSMGKWSLLKLWRTLAILFRMLKLIISRKPDLVLIPISQSTTGYFKDLLFILTARITGRKIIIHLRGSNFRNWLSSASALTDFIVRRSLRMTAGVIVLGNNLRPLFKDIFPPEKIFVCPNGADFNIIRNNKNNSVARVLYLANLQSSKGIEDLIAAVKILCKNNVAAFQLDVVGSWRSGVTEKLCRQIISENNLPVFMHPASTGEEKLAYFAGADVFVFPPRAPEGHPWVIVEAIAAGLPVISTDRGAITESVIDGTNGYIVAAGQPSEIAERLGVLIGDRSLRERMGKASRNLYENNFTERKMVDNLSRIFEKVMAA